MPLTVLIALVVAFGVRLDGEAAVLSGPAAAGLGLGVLGCLAADFLLCWLLCRVLTRRAWRAGGTPAVWRRAVVVASRVIDLLALGSFVLIIHVFAWPRVISRGLGLGHTILIDEVLILAPFVLALVAGWACLYPLDQRCRFSRTGRISPRGRWGYVMRRGRQALGLVLPAALLYALAHDLILRRWPVSGDSAALQFAALAGLGGLILVLAPAFVRLAWTTRPLPPGPLRERLEQLSRRLNFRFSDILVWDTEGNVVNAGVTGALPFFRYVLLTDALLDSLSDRQIEAVFGHEVGHVAHRHLGYFGFFCIGSMGIMALVCQGIDSLTGWLPWPGPASGWAATAVLCLEAGVALVCLGLYFYLLFGYLSRRFERQADVYGCRAVSCGRMTCPPHAEFAGAASSARVPPALCPVGIQTFASALSEVAALNGLEPAARSWRHGSILRRIAFLQGLEGRPEAERRFQDGVRRLRLGLALGLIAALAAAAATGAFEKL